MSMRSEWEFEYEAGRVADAARNREGYHRGRVMWWEAERDDVLGQLKESGLEITGHEVTGGMRHDVQFDPKLTKRLSECASKIQTHQREEERYGMYARVLAAQEDRTLKLHPDDVDYFGLAV